MKKKILTLLASTMVITYISCGLGVGAQSVTSSTQSAVSSSQSDVPDITAQTSVVADADTGQIYYQKNMHTEMYPASITKIMTGILAVEKGKDSDVITVSNDVSKGITSGVARIYLATDEQITQEEALYTLFLASANDSANALALHIGGTMNNFVAMMNARAKALGAVDTNFSNANGLPDTNNITSAYDMALITKRALEMPGLMKYFGAKSYVMPVTNKRNKTVAYQTLHKMMKNTVYKYDGVIAGKTGWETMSGHTLVTAAKRNGRTLICVVMKSSNQYTIYKDTIALLNYGFAQPSGGASADYLKAPVTAKVSVAASSKPVAAVQAVKKSEDPSNTENDITAPILLLAISICLFTFLITCRRSSKKSRHPANGRSNRLYAYNKNRFPSSERRRY
jgi:D-alanyl-D-alanine carboxypeptidase